MNILIRLGEATFFFSVGLLFYVYFGYPVFLFLFSRPRSDWNQLSPLAQPPRVSLLISAYNERSVIADKIRNSLELDYPPGLLEVIIISDCSDDGTDEIVREFVSKGVRLVRQTERLGKSAGLNLGVSRSSGDILVFSDANAIYQPDAILQLVRHFHSAKVGYVVGNARYVDAANQQASAESEGLYWKLETWLKEKESDFGSVVGGDGAIYAIRRNLFSPLLPTDINDFLNPLQIISRGYRGVYEPRAVCYEEAGDSFDKEFRRKVRIVSRSFNATRRAPAVLLPWVQPRHWFSLISHKVLRWFAAFFMMLALISALALSAWPFFCVAFFLQLAFYLLAAVGWMLEKRARAPKIFYLPYYFCLVNLAALLGIARFFGGSLSPTWQTVRSDSAPPAPDTAVSLAKKAG